MIEPLDDLSTVPGRYETVLFREAGQDVYWMVCPGCATVEATGDPAVLVLKPGPFDQIAPGIRNGTLVLRRMRKRGDVYDVHISGTIAREPETGDCKVSVAADASGSVGHIVRRPVT